MNKTISLSILALALGAGAAFAHCGNCPGDKKAEVKKEAPAAKKAGHDCGDCPMHKKEGQAKNASKMCGGVTCPEKLPGTDTVSRKIEGGVEVLTTSKNKETVAQIQELAMVHYGPKADKCPGCPTTVPGAETKVVNIENGIKVTITGKTPETVKLIQQASDREHGGPQRRGREGSKKRGQGRQEIYVRHEVRRIRQARQVPQVRHAHGGTQINGRKHT